MPGQARPLLAGLLGAADNFAIVLTDPPLRVYREADVPAVSALQPALRLRTRTYAWSMNCGCIERST